MRNLHRTLLLPLLLLLVAATPFAGEPASHNQQLYVLKTLQPSITNVGLLVSNDFAADTEAMTSVRRAAAGAGFKIFLGTVGSVRDVASKFRDLRAEGVDAVWVVEGSGVMNDRATRSFLIENSTRGRLPLLAPSAAWVSEGAAASVEKNGSGLSVSLNQRVLSALSITVPESLKSSAQMLAAN